MTLKNLLSAHEWLIEEPALDLARQNAYETLFTIGNGYLGTRGSFEERVRGDLPGTFLAGIYDHHDSTVVDLVSCPDWLPLSVWVDGERLSVQGAMVLEHRRVLDIRQGLLYRLTRFEDRQGRRTRLETLRFASLANRHLCGLRADITRENHEAPVAVEGGIDGRRFNLDRLPAYDEGHVFDAESRFEKWAKSRHLGPVSSDGSDSAVYLELGTLDRGHHLAYASSLSGGAKTKRIDDLAVAERVKLDFEGGQRCTVDKLVSIWTSRDVEVSKLRRTCLETLAAASTRGLTAALNDHLAAFAERWRDSDVVIESDGPAQRAVRYGIYHLLIAAGDRDERVSIGANALSGERYRGHVFWDTEIYLLPFYIYTQPAAARALLAYRYHTLEGAIANARANGYQGAQYAWEAADTGHEETPTWTVDGKHRLWMGEEEFHITADVAYGILTYVRATGDLDFLAGYGLEILIQTSRFWVSRLEHDAERDRFELRRVMGPDEFHEHVDNNAFTNRMVKWHLLEAADALELCRGERRAAFDEVAARLALNASEPATWQSIAERIHIPADRETGVIEQFDGYFDLKEAPITVWDENGMPAYPEGYHHFNSADTTLVKQPDALMLLYLLPDQFDDRVKRANYDFYEARTLHKSSLSPAIHAILGIEIGDTAKAESYFLRSALVDLADNQGNTEEGIHIASAGGTWQCVVAGFGGFRVKQGRMTFRPWLPASWRWLRFRLKWRGAVLQVSIFSDHAVFRLEAEPGRSETIELFDRPRVIEAGKDVLLRFSPGS
ncbi:MAG: glycosyl hydrolase family 65 protein [Alphaproteobacteria bacterium]